MPIEVGLTVDGDVMLVRGEDRFTMTVQEWAILCLGVRAGEYDVSQLSHLF